MSVALKELLEKLLVEKESLELTMSFMGDASEKRHTEVLAQYDNVLERIAKLKSQVID